MFEVHAHYEQLTMIKNILFLYSNRSNLRLVYFFQHIKRSTTISDDKGNKLPASLIFSISIKYLKDHLLQTLHNRLNFFYYNLHYCIIIIIPHHKTCGSGWDCTRITLLRPSSCLIRVRPLMVILT